jgi:hypothetical protein
MGSIAGGVDLGDKLHKNFMSSIELGYSMSQGDKEMALAQDDMKLKKKDFSLKELLTMQEYSARQDEINRKKKLRDLLAKGGY